jgi:hypothetical protein
MPELPTGFGIIFTKFRFTPTQPTNKDTNYMHKKNDIPQQGAFGNFSPPGNQSLADIPDLKHRRGLDVIPILLGERIDRLFSFPLFALRETLVLPVVKKRSDRAETFLENFEITNCCKHHKFLNKDNS